jgi:hypothetical protein
MSILSKAIIFWLAYAIIISISVGWALSLYPLRTGKPVNLDLLHSQEVGNG